jgi:hypothetical protein
MVEAGAVVHLLSEHNEFNILSEYLCFSEKTNPKVVIVLLNAGIDIRRET